MHYFLYVRLPGFYVREWARNDPSRADEAMAVYRDKRVIDANAPAHASGVRAGMGLDEAKVLLQGAGLIRWEEEPYRAAQARWLDTLCEVASTVEPDHQDSAWADLAGHPDPYAMARMFASRVAKQESADVALGLAGSKWLARLAEASFGSLANPAWEIAMRQACACPSEFLANFPIAHLAPVDADHRERLKFLGYRTIGDVAEIPLRTLRGQFGDAALTIRNAARGTLREPVRAVYPPDRVVAGQRFEGGLDHQEALGLAMGALARRIGAALRQREAQGAEVQIEIEYESTRVMRMRRFTRPIHTPREVSAALRLTLGEVNAPVWGLRVKLPGLKPAQERQANLYASRAMGDDVAASRAIEGLRLTFGDGSVMRASEKIEPRRIRVVRAWRHATGWH